MKHLQRLAGHLHGYAVATVALGLNLPLLCVLLARHLEGVPAFGVAGLYALLVFIGYYGAFLLALTTALFVVLPFARRLAVFLTGALFAIAVFYLVLNGIVHRVYRIHIDAFWVQYVLTNPEGLGVPASAFLIALGILVGAILLQILLFRVAGRLRRPGRAAAAVATVVVLCGLVSQAIHIAAYYRADARITSITPQLPFYEPVTSHRQAVKYAGFVPLGDDDPAGEAAAGGASIHYPLRPIHYAPPAGRRLPNIVILLLESWRADAMDSVTTPHMYALAQRSTWCLDHFSSGNATPSGVFGIFYAIHPTYWTAVKANSRAIDNPVFIDALQEHGYGFGIYADSHFERHRIDDAIFHGIPVHDHFTGATPDVRDGDLTHQLLQFAGDQEHRHQPFMGFAFFKATHFAYYYPDSDARFQPAKELNVAFVDRRQDPTPYLNDYRNSVRFVDDLVGRIVAGLDSLHALDHTIIVVTGDHGEEFNDDRANYWGHSGNFTQYQTRVPMMLYVPWRAPRRVTTPTAHVDIPTTLLQEVFGVTNDPRDYSNGRNLLEPPGAPRPIVVGGYASHAFVFNDDVFAVYPMYVRKYKLSNIATNAGTPPAALVREAMEETHRFYGPAEADPTPARAARP